MLDHLLQDVSVGAIHLIRFGVTTSCLESRTSFAVSSITASLTRIERARGFLEAAKLSEDWIRRMGEQALLLEAHHTTHIEGTHLTIEQSERLWAGQPVAGCT